MADLGELLGQNQAASEILEGLAVPGARLLRLTGPSGSGKSHIAFLAGATWRDDGGRCVIALGDDNHASRSLQPFLSGLASLPRSWTGLASEGSRSALRVADVVVGSAGAGASIFDLLSSAFRQRVERALRPFSNLERDIILDLKRLARSRPLLLIADNAHWWDADSLWLLRELVSDRLRTAVSQLRSVVVLLVDTAEEQHPSAPESFDPLVTMCERTWRTSRCRREQFPRVLKSMGLKQELPHDTLDALFAATGGHLKLAEQLALYSKRRSIRHLIASDERAYIATLLSARVASLGTSKENMAALLSRAAVIGLSFDEKELLCLAEDLQGPVSGLIERAEQISFLQRRGGRLSFSHDVIRSAILAEESPPLLNAHRKRFEECLSILRPGDYSARSELLLRAGLTERGRELFSLASIQQLRRGAPASRVLRQALFQFPDDEALQTFLSMMASAYESIASGDFTGPLPRLKTPLRGESPLMAAERNYLAALCCIELQTAAGIDEGASVLTSWEPSLRGEHEMRLRFLLLLQQAQVLAEMFDNARETERAIERKLLARSRYDHDAAMMLQVQNRRAAALNSPEVAELRIREAVAFSRRGPEGSGTDRLELFRSLNNLAAILIRLGRYADAYAAAREAERVVLDAPDAMARLDVLASNVVLAGLRSGVLPLPDAIARQELIIESPEGGDDKFIHRCNLCAYLLLAARDDEALEELALLREELRRNEFVESYLVYYLRSLEVTAAALHGDLDRASGLHAQMTPFVDALMWPCAPYVRRRQNLLASVLGRIQLSSDRASADTALLALRPSEIGPAWNYYARLLPCCELSFWSDS